MTQKGIGIIGLGYMGMHHLRTLQAMIKDEFIDFNYLQICDKDEQHLETIMTKYSLDGTTNASDITQNPSVQAIVIASPTPFHRNQCDLAFDANKAVYCEKPLGTSLQDTEQMISASHGKPNQVGLVLRHSPSLTYINELLQQGEIGKPQRIEYRHQSSFPKLQTIYRTSWKEDKKISGGLFREANIHDIDILIQLCGNFAIDTLDVTNDEQHKEISTNGTFYGGESLTFSTAWSTNWEKGTSRTFTVYGTHGSITADEFMFSGPVTLQKNDGSSKHWGKKELFQMYLEKKGIAPSFKRYQQWYSSLADFSFIKNLQDNTPCYPTFQVALPAEKKVQEFYDRREDTP